MTTSAVQTFTLKPLPYDYTALAPEISEETLRYHHDKHTAAYVAKLNELVAGTSFADKSLEEIIRTADGAIFNNAAQVWNHNFYFESLTPNPQPKPTGALLKAIDRSFGSFQGLKEHIAKHCTALFGSGWVWLVRDQHGSLAIMDGYNADNPLRHALTPLLCLDVWERAYYIDYRNARADAVGAHWNRIDWCKVEDRFSRK